MRLRTLAVLLLVPVLSAFAEDPASRMLDDAMSSEFELDPRIAAAIVAIARDDRHPAELRERALHALEVHQDAAYEKTALLVAEEHDYDPALAHSAARPLVNTHHANVRAVREEEAIAAHDVAASGAIAMDDDEAPETRGRAIQALIDAHSSDAHAMLLQLLEPRHWFFGVQAPILKLHSLAFVIDGLDANEDRAALELLRVRLASLPEHQRDDVAWRLDEKLKPRD